ncbi:MAG: 1-deoxy-D-xylulose-5-phosphate synthase [Oligoflexia bacterium]|nr:1-deoxy-D-xylulose-5-phosphate synthase [Oligoflexia bacterium]
MFLQKVNSPEDLKKLKLQELTSYVQELRQFMIEVMSKTGGHVAANLGVVELSAAIHYVFNTPEDKIVWDVGHQCYAHKIITGRRDYFHTIRQDGGISGFTKISESPYDVFGAGHSSTSISAGLGIAEAQWQTKTNNQVVSIIGDGALTAGMAYEGLNHAGHLRRPNFIVIFNDNEMSISENVGALAKFFGKRVNSVVYNKLRAEIKDTLKAISTPEMDFFEGVKKLTHSVKDLFSTTSFFEALGFRYIGPVDGQNVEDLVETLSSVKRLSLQSMANARDAKEDCEFDPPILVHVKTKKGYGLKTAQERPGDFHGVTGFDLTTGEPTKKPTSAPTYTSVFAKALCKAAQKDKSVVAVTAAMPDGTGLNVFQKQFPDRFYDVGIAEQHAVTFSAAMRLSGLKPAVALYSTFMQRAYDQLIHDAAIQKIPLALFLDRSGLVGADGPTHHGVFDMSYLRCVPGMHIMAPKDENELQHMVNTALHCNKLASVRFPRGEGVGVKLDDELKMLELGKSEKLIEHEHSLVSIWAAGNMVKTACDVAESLLLKQGLLCDVVNARFIKPLDDAALLKDAEKTKLIVTLEENAVKGGLGSEILESLAAQNIVMPVLNLGIPDEFIEHGAVKRLYEYCELSPKQVEQAIIERLKTLVLAKQLSPESAVFPSEAHH